MDILIKLFLNTSFAAIMCYIFYQFHIADGCAIIEIGYRSSSMEKKIRKKRENQSWFDYWLYWSLCRNAKKSRKTVWIYFALNLIPCTGIIIHTIVWFSLLLNSSTGEQLLNATIINHGKVFLSVLFMWGGLHYIFDLCFLPSEQKRYRLR